MSKILIKMKVVGVYRLKKNCEIIVNLFRINDAKIKIPAVTKFKVYDNGERYIAKSSPKHNIEIEVEYDDFDVVFTEPNECHLNWNEKNFNKLKGKEVTV